MGAAFSWGSSLGLSSGTVKESRISIWKKKENEKRTLHSNDKGGVKMLKISSSLMVLSAVFFSIGTLQPGYGMSFGKHNNGGGPGNPTITRGNGQGDGNGNGNTAYGASLEAQPYPLPVPEPATVVLLASGLFGVGLWRWKRQS
jgi:hypothetical protein